MSAFYDVPEKSIFNVFPCHIKELLDNSYKHTPQPADSLAFCNVLRILFSAQCPNAIMSSCLCTPIGYNGRGDKSNSDQHLLRWQIHGGQ